MHLFKYLLITIITFSCNKQTSNNNHNQELCIENQKEATELAEKEWLKVYGKNINKKKPFKAKLENDSIWIVEGALHTDLGGVPYAEINAKTCEIIKITHGK